MVVAADHILSGGKVKALVKRVKEAPTDNFIELLKIANLAKDRDLRFFDWSRLDFAGCNLWGCDFTGANLMGCRFEGAHIAGARFDAAQMDRAVLRRAEDWGDHKRLWTRPSEPSSGRHLLDLAIFSDAPFAPEMVALPTGEFKMGWPKEEKIRQYTEEPQHLVTIDTRFAIGRYPVTFEEYDHFCEVARRAKPTDEHWGRDRRPVINVKWEDAQNYCAWLSHETGQLYRLPSEAEWEYACRAEMTTRYFFGDSITEDANYGHVVGKTTEVGSYRPNSWHVYDMHGNVWEWVEDVYHDSYQGAPANGTAWTDREGKQPSRNRIVRGGCWFIGPWSCRSSSRVAFESMPNPQIGFRVARTLYSYEW